MRPGPSCKHLSTKDRRYSMDLDGSLGQRGIMLIVILAVIRMMRS